MPSAELMKQQSECLSVILEKNEKEEKSYVVGLEHVTEYQVSCVKGILKSSERWSLV